MNENEAKLYRYSVDFNTGNKSDFQYEKATVLCEIDHSCVYGESRTTFYGNLNGPERLSSALSLESCGKIFSGNDNEFYVFLSEENDELAKSLLAEKVRARHEEIKALYDRSHSALWFLEKEPREQKERKERADRGNFGELVHFLAETWYENEEEDIKEEITTFEDAIEESRLGEAYFGAAKGDYATGIDFSYNTWHAKFHADHYDGFSAPYCVCTWNDDFEKLEELFRNTAPKTYNMYQTRLSERFPESSMALDR